MTKKGQKFGLKMGFFWIVLKKRSPEKISGRKSQVFLVNIYKKGHREFGVPGNVIYKKALAKTLT